MVVGYVDPDGTNVAQWASSTGAPHHEQVDDAVRQPAAPPLATYVRYRDGDENDDEDYSFTSIAVSAVSNVKVWVYHACSNTAEDYYIRIFMGGGWTAQKKLDLTQAAAKWYSVNWGGVWTQVDLNALRVEYSAPPAIGKINSGTLYETYCEITYTAAGYGHNYMGVLAANIGNVNGVDAANIGSIKGV